MTLFYSAFISVFDVMTVCSIFTLELVLWHVLQHILECGQCAKVLSFLNAFT